MAYYDKVRYNGTDRDIRDSKAVHIEAEALTDAQKTQARTNIGAAGLSDLAGKVDTQQGSANAGKALVVGSDGVVTIGEAGIPEVVKVSLLDLVRHVAYIDDQGQAYYDALYAALYGGDTPAPGYHYEYIVQDQTGPFEGGLQFAIQDVDYANGEYIEWAISRAKEWNDSYPVVCVGETTASNPTNNYTGGKNILIMWFRPTVGLEEITCITRGTAYPYAYRRYTADNTPLYEDNVVIRLDKDGVMLNGTRYFFDIETYAGLIEWLTTTASYNVVLPDRSADPTIDYIRICRKDQ